MRHTGRVRGFVPVLLGSALAVVLGLSGCGGADQDASSRTLTPLPSASSVPSSAPASTSPSAAPSKAPVVRAGPPPKTPFTRAGAELFVRDYYATIDGILGAAPGSMPRRLAHALARYVGASCECRYTVHFFVRHTLAGDRYYGRGYRLLKVAVVNMAGNSAVVAVTFGLGHVVTRDAHGNALDIQDAVQRETDTFVVAHTAGSWVMTRQMVGRAAS